MAIEYAPFEKKFNETNCGILGIEVSEEFSAIVVE